mgnify:FL=1
MGNTFSSKKCHKCKLCIGDYDIDYLLLFIGKGKYNGLYFCPTCLHELLTINLGNINTESKVISNYSFEDLG